MCGQTCSCQKTQTEGSEVENKTMDKCPNYEDDQDPEISYLRVQKRQSNNANITKLYNFNKYSSDMKKMWKGIRSIVNIKQSTVPQIT